VFYLINQFVDNVMTSHFCRGISCVYRN